MCVAVVLLLIWSHFQLKVMLYGHRCSWPNSVSCGGPCAPGVRGSSVWGCEWCFLPSESREEPSHLATKVWEPNKMPDHKVEQFLVVARSIGTFARALLDGAKKPQISLRLGAAAASRDITLVSWQHCLRVGWSPSPLLFSLPHCMQFHAMDTLHQNDYDITQATSYLVPRGPVLCADELEAWTQG